MWSCSQVLSGRSSATPRSSVIGLWTWALTRPGTSTPSGRDTVAAGLKRARASARGSTATIAPSRMATAWSSSTTPCGSTGTTQPASMTRSQTVAWPLIALLDARDVLAGAGIDLDGFVLGDEQRHAHHRAGLQRGRLAAGAGGVALHARVGLDDLQLDEVRRRHHDRRAVEQRHHALLLALEPLLGAAHAGLVGLDLLEGLLVHEVPVLAVGIPVLHVGIDHVCRLERVGRLHGDFLHAAGADLAILDAGERLALARLDVLGVGDDRGFVVDQDLLSVLDVVHAEGGHRLQLLLVRRGGRLKWA